MTSAEQPGDHPGPPPESLGSDPEIQTERSRRILQTRNFLTRINGYERFARFKGEVDPEEWHHHAAAKQQVLRAMKQLSPVDQEILEAAFPTDGSPVADLQDEATRNELADTFGVQRPAELHREVDESLERLGNILYA